MTAPTSPAAHLRAPASSSSKPERAVEKGGLSLTRYERDGCTVVEAAGEIDLDVAPLLREVLAGSASPRVVVDLSDVTFVDSTGLAMLVETRRGVETTGGWVRLVLPQDAVLKVLRITQLDRVMSIHGSVDEAIAPG